MRQAAIDLELVAAALEAKGYAVSRFATAATAADYLDSQVDGRSVGFGDSETLLALGLYDRLSRHNQVWDPMHPAAGESFNSVARRCLGTDIFFTSVNALAASGEMVNIDGTGNRVAGSLFGHERVYFVLGINKIAPSLDLAIERARQVAAPLNAARHHFRTPCAVKRDHCFDCKSPDRICCAQVIYYQKMRFMDMEVVLIEEDLGL